MSQVLDYGCCVVIPVYNHEQAVEPLVNELLSHSLPIILIDDGSRSACRDVLVRLAACYDLVTLISLSANQGKGGAVKAGLLHAATAGFTHALQIDADGQHCTQDIPQFVNISRANFASVVAGCPVYDQSVPRGRLFARYLTHLWVWINTLSFKIKDSMCGFRVYPLVAICELINREHTGNRMDFDTEVMVRWVWRNGDVVNVPTKVCYPKGGVSHFKLWNDNVLISYMHARLFFGMLLRLPRLLARKLSRSRKQIGIAPYG